MNPEQIVSLLLEGKEEPRYFETWQQLRPATAAVIQAKWEIFSKRLGREPDVDDDQANIGIGNTRYEKRDGKWYRLRKDRNPAYWNQAQYFVIYPGPNPCAFIIVKMPRRLSHRAWRRACAQIFPDATGQSWYKEHPGVDGVDKGTYDCCVSGKRPEPAYEILDDGTWKRTSPRKQQR